MGHRLQAKSVIYSVSWIVLLRDRLRLLLRAAVLNSCYALIKHWQSQMSLHRIIPTIHANRNVLAHILLLPHITLQNITAIIVVESVATSPGPIIAVGLALPYWLLYAMIVMGIS